MAAHHNRPTYDFLTGGPPSPGATGPSRAARDPSGPSSTSALKLSTATVRPADPLNEELRTRIQTLEYELRTVREDTALAAARAASDVSNAERGLQREYERAEAAEAARRKAEQRAESVVRDAADREAVAANEKAELERRARRLAEDMAGVREEADEAGQALKEVQREGEWRAKEVEGRLATALAGQEEALRDLSVKAGLLEAEQRKVVLKEGDVARLEGELLAAKAGGAAGEEVGVLKAQLSEQVAHIRRLEMQARDQNNELKAFRQQRKAVEVVEEEKRVLEGKIRALDEVGRELGSVRQRAQALEDEKRAWTAYLEQGGEGTQFESPEDLAKAFMDLRLENAGLVERLGAVEPEIKVKDDHITSLEEGHTNLQAEIERLRASGANGGAASDSKAKARLERQRALAVKEVDYLRAQLKAFDAEESEFQPEQYDEQKSKRVKELEEMVDEYRNELQGVQADLAAAEEKLKLPQTPVAGTKRAREDHDDERLGELRRKNRQLQDSLSKLQTKANQLQSELQAKASQMEALKAPSRTRILELRNNPTAQVEQIKLTTLQTLQEENKDLHTLLERNDEAKPDKRRFVPKASLEALRLEMEQLRKDAAQEKKLGQRRKDLFSAKANEFRDAVLSLVGWKVNFLPNGRVKVASIFNNDKQREAMGEENSITFDVEQETMKISGGPESEFAGSIREAVEFWVEGKKEIPCFLAALTLDFYEKKHAELVA